MENAIRKAAVIGLSASLVLTSLSGCSKKKESFDTEAAAITVNGDTISAGVLNFAVRYNQASLESLYQSLGVDDPYNEDLFGTGSTLGEQAKSQLTTTLTEALLAEQHMEDYGVTISDTEKEQITAAATQFINDNDAEVLEELGIDQASVERYLELNMIQDKVEVEMSADVDTEVSDEEAAQRRVQYVLFTPVTEEETEEETETEVLTEAETEAVTEAVTEVETEGETKLEETETETETETAALEEETSAKTKSADETETEAVETESETAVAEAATESATEAISEAAETEIETETETETEDPETVAARERAYAQAEEMIALVKAGTDFEEAAETMGKSVTENTFGSDYSITALVEATEGLEDDTLVEEPVLSSTGSYYVVKVVSQLDREATDEEKESIVEDRKQECIDDLYDEWTEAGEVSTDEDVLAKITFDYHLAQAEEEETEAAEVETESLTEAVEAETEADSEASSEVAETEADTEAAETETEAETK